MSDRPLFTNTDEQEKVYAPQHSPDPEGQTRAALEEGTLNENRAAGTSGDNDGAGVSMPIPGPGGASAGTGGIASGLNGGPPVGIAPTRVDDDVDDARR